MSDNLEKLLSRLDESVQVKLDKLNGQVTESGEATRAVREELKSALGEWSEVKSDLDRVKSEITDLAQKGQIADEREAEAKSMGAQFMESDQFAAFKSKQATKASIELKTTFVNNANATSRMNQLDGVFGGAFRALRAMPTFDQFTTDSNLLHYGKETAWTNAAAPQGGEGVAKAESALTVTPVSTAIETVAHFLPVSKQALDDSSFLASYIDRRMSHGVMNKTERQMIQGDGTGNNFSGWAAAGNSTATSPLLTVDIFGLASKMKSEIIAADYEPDFFYFNPVDWQTVETLRRAGGDNGFIAAAGVVDYVNNGMTAMLWGLPVVISNNVPAGTIYCKSRDADAYADRQQVTIEMFEQDSDNVQKNLITVRGESRGAALNFAPLAIRSGLISGITAV